MANYLYNGVELPDVESASGIWTQPPPYKMVFKRGDQYLIVLCSDAFSHVTQNGVSYIATNGKSLWCIQKYRVQSSGNRIWSTSNKEFDATQLLLSAGSIVWTSHDILYENSTDIFLARTEPILVPDSGDTDPDPVPVPTLDPQSLTAGWLVGKKIAAMRGKV